MDGKPWGFISYLIRQSYFEELVRENLLDEHDVCFITDKTDINAFISSAKDGPFSTVPDVPDREKKLLSTTEKEASQALIQAFKENESGQVNTALNNPIAGSNEMTFYFSSIESDEWMLVMGRSKAVTEKHAGVLSYTLADIISDSKEVVGRYFISTIAFSLLAIIAAAVAASNMSRIYVNKLTAPIRTLTDKVEALRGDSLDFSWTRMGEEGDETEILAEAFGVMTDRIKEDIRHITEMTSERERIAAELSFAAEIQAAMLPPLTEEFTDGNGFTLYASMRPAKAVGGDFYDFFMIDPDHLAFIIADVSDKGMGAALFMAISKSVIRACALSGGSVGEVLKSADAILSENNEISMFVTVFFAVLEISTGKVAACNAGHDYPMVCFAEEEGERSFRILQEEHSMPLAFGLSGAKYPELSWQLSEGDRIFLYTDGVNEAQGRSEEQFGMERMLDVLNANMEKGDRELLAAMREAVGKFVGDDPQFDDMTMLLVTYRG
ncbi:MAG: SpoIIE family protein phosphatase [Lachnospiraceae bacterium]|nr:SpoIIE family protein phosphatase [Lachnospiraceae bacterium]